MRILLVTEFLPASDDGEITGGVEAYCHYVSGHLRGDNEVILLGRRTDGSVWEDARLGSLPGRLLFLLRTLVGGLRDPGDVVVSTTYVVHPVAWLIGKLRRRPVVFWYPDVLLGTWRSGQFGTAAGIVGELVERVLLKLPVARYIAISDSTREKLVVAGVPAERVVVIPCGFETSMVEDVAVPADDAPAARVVVVSRLVGYKHVDVVVRAFGRLHADHADVELLVIGQGPERPALEALTRQLGIADRVQFRGFVERHADVLQTVAASDVFASASQVEGFGIVLVEAMALGVPYVATDIPAHREVTGGGVGGRLVPVGDDAAFAGALVELLESAQVREGLGSAGREHSGRYRWSAVAEQTAAVLQSIVLEAGRTPAP